MAQSEDAPACEGEKNSLNTVQDSIFSHEELIELIRCTYMRLIELDDELQKIKNHGARYFKISDAKV